MGGALARILVISTITAFLVGVASEARVCYFGPPPEPDPDNPDDWIKRLGQVMQEIRQRCPRNKEHTSIIECRIPEALGLEDGTIPNDRITTSSNKDNWPPRDGRLNGGRAWKPKDSDDYPWIEVDLAENTIVAGVTTQGYSDKHLEKYKVAYKKTSLTDYEHVTDENENIKWFTGNTDGNTIVTNLFDASVVATIVRISAELNDDDVALRLELLGCHLD